MYVAQRTQKDGMVHIRIMKSVRTGPTSNTTVIVKDCGIFNPNDEGFNDKVNEFKSECSKLELEDANKPKILKSDFVPQIRMKKISEKNRCVRAGYLFPQAIYYSLGFTNICSEIKQNRRFEFNLDAILRDLLIGRIIEPRSKLGTYKLAQSFFRQPKYSEDDIYNAMDIIHDNFDFINRRILQNRKKLFGANTSRIYYDCTNIFFETEIEDDNLYRSYGKGKEHRPNPIVQIGLMMDGDAMPLDIITFNGRSNEQPSLQELERKMIKNLGVDDFIICTDAGLNSIDNMIFNSDGNRSFIAASSLKKIKSTMADSLMGNLNWKIMGHPSDDYFKLDELLESKYKDCTFYKDDEYEIENPKDIYYVMENGKKVKKKGTRTIRYIITFSKKTFDYQRKVRKAQIERAMRYIKAGDYKRKGKNENDPRRFISVTTVTNEGEVAENEIAELDFDAIAEEEKYDGFLLCCTNLLNDKVEDIIDINQERWEIEETFRIMKTDLNLRPVFHSKEERIDCHVKLCYLSILLLRLLEKQLDGQLTMPEILEAIRGYNLKQNEYGYGAAMEMTPERKILEEKMGFSASYDGMYTEDMENINRQSREWYKKFESQRKRGKDKRKNQI